MINKIKKGKLGFFLLLVAGLVLPFYFVDGLASTIASYTASALTGIFLFVIATVSLVFSTFADWFLRVTLGPEFINIPYTTGNEFVMYGWGVVRDFVNMFFVLVLIIIGLSTSLQIETYRWQKTLPRLVMVALLINFTPVVLGVVIDASNIMMNYFAFSLGEESVFIRRMVALYDVMASNLADTPWTSFSGAVITPVAMMVIFTIFNLFTGIVYGIYGIIFAMRYVAIWLLVIISPFGFFCYILPATQGFFRKWWNWFIGWCIAGISAAFFLYLGEVMFNERFLDQGAMIPDSTQHQGMEIGSFTHVFPLLIPLLFIAFGLLVTVGVSIAGAKGIVQGLQKASGAARRTSQNLPGSTFKEKTQAASGAVRNAFRPEMQSVSSSTGGGDSGSTTESKGKSLYRRNERNVGGKTKTGTSRKLSSVQITTSASQGTQSAIEGIAAEFDTSNVGASMRGRTTPGKKEEDQKKCSSCGAAIDKNASFCPLCRKDALGGGFVKKEDSPSDSPEKPSSSERPTTPQNPADSISK